MDDPTALLETNSEGTSWFTGPKFLPEDEQSWPSSSVGELDKDDPEIKRRSLLVAVSLLQESRTINTTKFSSWITLNRIVAWALRFVANCKKRKRKLRSRQKKLDKVNENCCEPLTCEELRAAGKIIIKDMQREVFHEEFRLLGESKGLPKGNQLVSLSPFIDPEGMLRVGGRLKNAPIPDCSKHQIIIPKDH